MFGDARGYFLETWNRKTFAAHGLEFDFVQTNQTRSTRGTLRGLHYQIEQAQGKLVRVVTGSVFDVAVDLRRSSESFGRWIGTVLSEDNKEMIWIPPGFAHGLLVLSDTAHVEYKCTDFYAPEHERTIRWDDEALAIAWPLEDGRGPLLSAKDRQGLGFGDAEFFP